MGEDSASLWISYGWRGPGGEAWGPQAERPPSISSGRPSGKAAVSGAWQGTKGPHAPSVGIVPNSQHLIRPGTQLSSP